MKINVRRVGTGVAAASTLVVAAGGGGLGCATEGELEQEALGASEDALSAGSAKLEMGWAASKTERFQVYQASSTTDEFLRVGQSLSLSIPSWIVWDSIHPGRSMPSAAILQQSIQSEIEIFFYDQGKLLGSQKLSMQWNAEPASLRAVTKASVTIPAKTDRLAFGLIVRDTQEPSANVTIKSDQLNSLAVFGGELPNKTVIFDNNINALRQRIIEGDKLVHGAKANFVYTDWRADTLVERGSIDAQIGVAKSYGRFGAVDSPIYGKVVHEVSYSISYNDGQGWRPEKAFTPNTQSILGPNRTSFESTETIPAKATKMQVYFHVKTYVIADYSGYPNVLQKWYGDGERILKRDKYDNPSGSGSNYDFPLQ